jgi:hypothetical protein
MAYQINKTDGTLLTEIVDSAIDQDATDLTLIGKNVSGYGEYINENFIKLLENFASETQPTNPIKGQLWYDTTENRLKAYDGSTFRLGSGPIVAPEVTANLVQGDLWIDSAENQLYFYDGVDLQLAGPLYKDSQGISGPEVETIFDTNNVPRTIVKEWVGATLMGIWSKEVLPFFPKQAIPGFSGAIGPGFNGSTLSGLKFNITASRSNNLIDEVGNVLSASSFMRTDGNTGTSGTISIASGTPLILGAFQNNEVRVDSTSMQIVSNTTNQNFRLRVKTSLATVDAITVSTATSKLGIFQATPAYTLDVGGDLRVTGNLLVEGTTTTVNTNNLVVEDHVIELAANSDSSISDEYANQGGIVLRGTTDHSIIWNKAPASSWKSSEHWDLALGKEYKINGNTVITANSLGSAITSAPGLTSLPTLTFLGVDYLEFNGATISTSSGSVQDIILSPDGASNVNVASSRIVNLSNPVDPSDAVNKSTMDTEIATKSLVLSMDVTGLNDTAIAAYLDIIAPYPEFGEGTVARILCTVTYPSVNFNQTTSPDLSGDFVKYYISVDNSGNVGAKPNEPVLQDFDINTIDMGNGTIQVSRTVKEFTISTGVWAFSGTLSGTVVTPP